MLNVNMDWVKRCMMMEVEELDREDVRLDSVRGDMQSCGLSLEDAQDKDQWKLRLKGELDNMVYLENGQNNGACVFQFVQFLANIAYGRAVKMSSVTLCCRRMNYSVR